MTTLTWTNPGKQERFLGKSFTSHLDIDISMYLLCVWVVSIILVWRSWRCGVLTGVCAAVSLQVGALGVHLVAPGKVTTVNSPLFQRVGWFSRNGMLRARVNYYRWVIAPVNRKQKQMLLLSPGGGAAAQEDPPGVNNQDEAPRCSNKPESPILQ